MKLGVLDRLLVAQILPTKGRIIEMQVIASLKSLTMFTAKEMAEFELRDTVEGVLFNPSKAIEVEYSLTLSQLEVLRKAVNDTDEAGEVTEVMLPLFNKILNAV